MFGDPILNRANYEVKDLAEVIDRSRPITYGILKPGPDTDDGVPYVRVVDIKGGHVRANALRRTTPAIAKEYRRSTLCVGDLLISIRGHVGRMAVAPAACEGANITQDTARLAVAKANVEFVRSCLAMPSAQDWMAKRTKGAAVRGINLGDLRRFPLPIPPHDLQLDFAKAAEAAQRMVFCNQEQHIVAEALFASLQSRAFTGQL